jgi:hypothetical protein
LQRDSAGSPCDVYGIGHAIEAIEQYHHVGSFRRSTRAARTHRDPDISCRQRGRVINSIADHDRTALTLFGSHRIDFVSGFSFRENGIKVESSSDCLGGVRPIACHHHDPLNTRRSQVLHCAWRLSSKFVSQ